MMYAVIMAGGSGTRLWPLSRKSRPKQALQLVGERTLFQQAVERLDPLLPPERILVVTSPAMADLLRPQAPQVPRANFILEPHGRDSAPAAGLAAIHVLSRDPDAVMAILTADHHIADGDGFRAALAAAGVLAEDGYIVTLGIRPTYPATGFGYIELGEILSIQNGLEVYKSAGFREKPDIETATRFVQGHHHVWNSGMFIWRADRLLKEIGAQLPDLRRVLARMDDLPDVPGAGQVRAESWAQAPRISIDYGIMEHADRVVVIPVDLGWSDVGSWAALREILEGDAQGNILSGQVVALDSTDCLVRSEGRLVALIGLHDLIIVDTPDVLLVCPHHRAQEVRELVKRLMAEAKEEFL